MSKRAFYADVETLVQQVRGAVTSGEVIDWRLTAEVAARLAIAAFRRTIEPMKCPATITQIAKANHMYATQARHLVNDFAPTKASDD